ncbi:hypothetical protein ZWY2020_046403 [Hordeum vulgare]|nr:hypothetical protein ZWY2020_046403 [Hordeum vulgare]
MTMDAGERERDREPSRDGADGDEADEEQVSSRRGRLASLSPSTRAGADSSPFSTLQQQQEEEEDPGVLNIRDTATRVDPLLQQLRRGPTDDYILCCPRCTCTVVPHLQFFSLFLRVDLI